MSTFVTPGSAVLLCLVACGNEGGTGVGKPLAVDSTRPLAAAVGVEVGTSVRAYLNKDAAPSTVTPSTFTLSTGGTSLPSSVTYLSGAKAARLAGPLLPGTIYQAAVLTGVQDVAGTPLSAPHTWTFTTRSWQSTVADPTSDAGRYTSLALDGTGRVHVSHYDITRADLRYATCAAACTTPGNWQGAAIDTTGNVGLWTSLAVDGTSRLHVSYWDGTNGHLKYATCVATCGTAGSWQVIAVDQAGAVGEYTSLALGVGGALHVSYFDLTNGDLKYATCSATCGTPGNWQVTAVDTAGTVGRFTSLAVDGTGRVHVSYYNLDNGYLKYATCAATCTALAGWQTASILQTGGPAFSTASRLAVDGTGRVQVTHYDLTNGDLIYMTCAANCTTLSNWSGTAVDSVGDVGSWASLVVDATGRAHISYLDATNGDLKYATCAASCATTSSWQLMAVDQTGLVGAYTSLAVDASGAVHVSYRDATNGTLKYIR
jgi:hypothetical protein